MAVYVVQRKVRRNDAGEVVPVVDLSPATVYGDIVEVFAPGRVALLQQVAARLARRALKDYSDEDYLLPMGDPSLIAIAAAVAAEQNRGVLHLLRWDRTDGAYAPITVDTRRY